MYDIFFFMYRTAGEKMKNIRILIVLCLLVVSGCCNTNTSSTSERGSDAVLVNKTVEREAQGIITDITNTHMNVIIEDGDQLHIDRTKMETSETLYLGASIHIVYTEDKDGFMGKSFIVLSNKNTTDDKIHKRIQEMSIAEQVGQLFMARCPSAGAVEAISKYHMGGYILFDNVIRPYTSEQLIAQNQAYQENSDIPMLIGVDEEGGTVNRLSRYTHYRSTPFESPQQLYAKGGFDLVTKDTTEKNTLLRKQGININFAPVADVSTNPDDFIYARTFGKDQKQTATYINTVVKQMKKDIMGSVLKHFPGYGDNLDTHTGSSLDKRTLEEFQEKDFIPFIAGIKAGASSVLVSHNIMTCIDKEYPASLSIDVHRLLRDDLGFTGVIITDDLQMDAIRQFADDGQAAVLAIQAGNDMLISSNYQEQIPYVIKAVENGIIREEQIQIAVHRVLRMKVDLGLLKL